MGNTARLIAACVVIAIEAVPTAVYTLVNPSNVSYANATYDVGQTLRLPVDIRGVDVSTLTVTRDGELTGAWQVEVATPGVPPPPFTGVTLSGAYGGGTVGGSAWDLPPGTPAYVSFSATVSANGTLFSEVVLNYTFSGGAFASWRVTLLHDRWGPLVREAHSVGVDAGVELALHAGWAPDTALSWGWNYCDVTNSTNSSMLANQTQSVWPLAPQARLPGGALAYMQPRWSQACDSKYYFGAWDSRASSSGNVTLGVLALLHSEWNWAQYRGLDWYTMKTHLMTPWSSGAGTGFVRLPLYGRRTWYMLSGPRSLTADSANGYELANSQMELDRLTNTYDLAWPGLNDTLPGDAFCAQWFLGANTNPTAGLRHVGKSLLVNLSTGVGVPPPSICTLSSAQVWADPDWWAAYVGYYTPENNNFNTDFNVLGIGYALAVVAGQHPHASFYCSLAWGLWTLDLAHSVTMPSGAGAESPGYTEHALEAWYLEAPLLDAYCPRSDGVKAVTFPPYVAAILFLYRTSQPWAYHFNGPAAADNSGIGGRWVLPLGDTHPFSVNYTRIRGMTGVAWSNPSTFASEELVGFGAMLQARAGTPQETFLAFKASPNRGHNHGDQLSFHHAAYGARIVIDLMAGYNPRPYQEFWHNRVCFGELTGGVPASQNLDQYERLIAFNTTAGVADVAVGQVGSARLQSLPSDPPLAYLGVYNITPLSHTLTYRRTAVLVHAPARSATSRDYVVLVDAHNASGVSPAVGAYTALTFFQQDGMVAAPIPGTPSGYDMGNGTVYTFAANGDVGVPVSFVMDRWDWPSEGDENATRVRVFPDPPTAPTTLFVTLLYPDGSTMPDQPPRGMPTVNFDAGRSTLTVALPDGTVDVLAFSGSVVDAGTEPDGGAGRAAGTAGTAAPPAGPILTLARGGGAPAALLLEADLNLLRWQGDVGLTILDAGYEVFGETPQWVIDQRTVAGPGGLALHMPAAYPWPPNDALQRLVA